MAMLGAEMLDTVFGSDSVALQGNQNPVAVPELAAVAAGIAALLAGVAVFAVFAVFAVLRRRKQTI